MLTMPDSALQVCAVRLYYFMTSQNLDYKCLRWDRNVLYVYQILLISRCYAI